MSIAPLHGFSELGDDMRRRGLIRIPHAEIDDVLTPRTGLFLQLADDIEDIGGQAPDTLEFGFHGHTINRKSPEKGRDRTPYWGARVTSTWQRPDVIRRATAIGYFFRGACRPSSTASSSGLR